MDIISGILLDKNEMILRLISIFTIIIAYPTLSLFIAVTDEENFLHLIEFLLIVFGYPFIWIIVSLSIPSREHVKKNSKLFWLTIGLFTFYMAHILLTFLPLVYEGNIRPETFVLIHVGIIFAFAQPISVYLLRRAVEIHEAKLKMLRKKGVQTLDDLYAFRDLDDSFGIARILTEHQDVDIRRKSVDILFDSPYDSRVLKYITSALEDADDYVRLKSAMLLFIYDDKRGLNILMKRFHELTDNERLEVITWIPEHEDDTRFKEFLQQALYDDNHDVREKAKEYMPYYE